MQSPMTNNADFERRNGDMEVGRAFQDNQRDGSENFYGLIQI